jgi:hypothetical protein
MMEMMVEPVAPVVVCGSPPVISKAVGTSKVASPLGSAQAAEPGKRVHPAKRTVRARQQTRNRFLFAVIVVLLDFLGLSGFENAEKKAKNHRLVGFMNRSFLNDPLFSASRVPMDSNDHT